MTKQQSEVTTKRIAAMLVAQLSSPAAGFNPGDIGPVLTPLFPQLFERLAANGLTSCGAPLAYYLDAPDGEGIIVHAAIAIEQAVDNPQGLTLVELPALDQAATIFHHGSMDECMASYDALVRWIGEQGLKTIGYSREISLHCPADHAQWVTELQFAVTPL